MERIMTIKDVKNLQTGDEVFWTDPDDNLTSRYLTIQEIEIVGDDVFKITAKDGDYLEGYLWELS